MNEINSAPYIEWRDQRKLHKGISPSSYNCSISIIFMDGGLKNMELIMGSMDLGDNKSNHGHGSLFIITIDETALLSAAAIIPSKLGQGSVREMLSSMSWSVGGGEDDREGDDDIDGEDDIDEEEDG